MQKMQRTERLLLRPWRASDLAPFATINADPKVMEFYPAPLTRLESDALAEQIQQEWTLHAYGFWAVEVPGVAPFVGYIGLHYWNLEAPFAPCVDVGWRLDSRYWGRGYATEGARAALRYGFESLRLPEIVAMATVHNTRSRRVMERLGMQHDPAENFHHPKLPREHPLSLRVLYRLKRSCERGVWGI
jgi:RimJ/RimL family protein N-acetyltransferase